MVGGSTPWYNAKSVKMRLDGPSSAKHVAGHRFRGTDGQRRGPGFKYRLDGHRFRDIAGWGRGGMGIDVVHPISGHASITQGIGHTARCSSTVRAWRGEMVRIASAAVANNFAIDARPTTTGMLQFFQDERTGPSAITKPSRSRSKGRLASWGSSCSVTAPACCRRYSRPAA